MTPTPAEPASASLEVSYQLTGPRLTQARQAAIRRMRQGAGASFMLMLLMLALLGLLIGMAQALGGSLLAALALWVPLWVGMMWWQQAAQHDRANREQAGWLRLRLDAQGVHTWGEGEQGFRDWQQFIGRERGPDVTWLHLKGYAALPVPDEAFATLELRQQFDALIERVPVHGARGGIANRSAESQRASQEPAGNASPAESASISPPAAAASSESVSPAIPGAPAVSTAPASPAAEDTVLPPPGPRAAAWLGAQARAFARNLRAGALGAVFRAGAERHVAPGVAPLMALFAASLLVVLADGLWREGLDGRLYPWSLPTLAFPFALGLLAVWTALAPAGAGRHFLSAAVATAAVLLVIDLITVPLFAALDHLDPAGWDTARQAAAWLWWAWVWAATLAVIVRVAGLSPRARGWAAVVLPLLWLWPGGWYSQGAQLWVEDWEQQAQAAQERPRAATEQVLARQPELLDDALDRVRPGRAGRTELFYVVMGPYGAQDVFVRESRAARALLEERFHAQDRGVLLANHASAALELPFAHLTNLRAALAAVAGRMNGDEDVLFLYITTHGSHDHQLAVNLWPYQFDAITPAMLRAALDEAGIRHRVVVLSACFAGGFIPALEGPDTAVFTAAAPDRQSFGCADGRDWTYFGEAFYTQGLARSTDLEEVFELARTSVTEREKAEGQKPSLPQSSVGEGIRAKLRELAAAP